MRGLIRKASLQVAGMACVSVSAADEDEELRGSRNGNVSL